MDALPPQSEEFESPEVCKVCCELRIHADVSQGILLTSEAHTSLFYHDEEIISHFQSQMEIANHNTTVLEEELHKVVEDCEFARKQQYQCQIAWFNEAQARTTAERHLRLETHRYNECAEAFESLGLQHGKLESDMQAMFTLNEMLRKEVEHGQHIIDSMAGNISELERVANGFVAFSRQPFQPADLQHWSAVARSPESDEILTPGSAADLPSSMAFLVSPTVTDIEDSPQASTTRLGGVLLEPKKCVKKARKPRKPRKEKTEVRVTEAEPRGWMKMEETS
jgi:hypothetical protein